MMKKGILSLATLGLLASPLSFTTAHAEGNNYNLLKKSSESHVEKLFPKGAKEFHTFNSLNLNSHLTSFTNKPSINLSNYTTEADEIEELYEEEVNDDFDVANDLPIGANMYGQLLPLYDEDLYKIVVPTDGKITLGGTAFGSENIILAIGIYQKDFVEDNKLVYLGYDYDEDTDLEQQYYQAKAGTYYVAAWDDDNDEYDDNTEDDYYGVYTLFNVAPSKPTVNKVDNNDLVVTGKAEAGSIVTVKNGSTVLGTPIKATSNGTYSVKIPVQKAGVTLSVYAKDFVGKTSVAGTTKVVDVIAPAKPVVNRVDNNDVVVTGKAEAGSTVAIKRGTTTLATVKATSTGTFSAKIAVQVAGTKLTVTAKDAAGNISVATTVTVVDVIPPGKPTINKVDDNDLKVTGKAEKGSLVTVKKGTTVLGSATTNSSGVYSVSIKAQKKGTVISVTAKDKAGNTSAAATYTVVKH
ncbi:Ig-like domain-containing protein [Gottfriedia acidiceleris]|uniref:Ig-like domain-containing protein n=1 Tax=Gottfriedia acidiceleris TaxID=371036 RepID=A0ABY4JMZ7_9BACI|nr:Ig-like domain-containing protein [Gottfriedia acidiceleris]UPM54862.1 Ig-like domain-containing protein [Gottfriedia acidiceleris]